MKLNVHHKESKKCVVGIVRNLVFELKHLATDLLGCTLVVNICMYIGSYKLMLDDQTKWQ